MPEEVNLPMPVENLNGKKNYFPIKTTNDCQSNLSSEHDDESTKLQKFGLESNV